MKQERTIVTGLFLLLLILWLGFLVHRAPTFPGSFIGGILAITATSLLVIPSLLYSAVKRIPQFKEIIRKHVSLGTLLTAHVYTGILGAIIAILHTGHRFESSMGIWLTTLMMLTVLSGFIGRYFLAYSSHELHEKKEMLNVLAYEYNKMVNQLSQQPHAELTFAATRNFLSRATHGLFVPEETFLEVKAPPSLRAMGLVESIADVEYAIKMHEALKRKTRYWLYCHLVTSCAFYLVLTMHIWTEIDYGIIWLK
ncbi:TPA: hypothetical protein ACXYLK_003202 [Legionella pneumophila]|uniref:hypothetical protein n=1 Tax=Legionella anisa TaxID=28082 RepID=UPI0003483EA8|nr:hypothetical protein [Legionella anisa]AWN75929.1 hypothetical protein DLD14_18770 [Legionella anisa]MBN5937693.1 hypothetical protein [Legionella anisa]MCW8426798.1 hypothetical protein [Legionella anisa]MCW8449533.1 hypothetical protein [Legionella anisa]